MKLHETPCPDCKEIGTLTIEEIFYAKPIGDWSLAGAQNKGFGSWKPVLTCQGQDCFFTRAGQFDGDSHAVFDAM